MLGRASPEAVVVLAGDVHPATAERLRATLWRAAERSGRADVVLDVAGLSHIAGSCLAVLGAFAEQLIATGRNLVLSGASPAVVAAMGYRAGEVAESWSDEGDPEPLPSELAVQAVDCLLATGLEIARAAQRSGDEAVRAGLAAAAERLDQLLGEISRRAFLAGRARERHFEVDLVVGTRTLRLAGELDLCGASVLRAILDELGTGPVTLDLSALRLIDASGIAAIVEERRRRDVAGDRLRVEGATGIVRRVFEIVGLDGPLLHGADGHSGHHLPSSA